MHRRLRDPGDPDLRKSGIGGSDSAAIMGVSDFGGPLEVYLEKKGLTEFEENRFTEWGDRHEPTILLKYAEVAECKVLCRIDNRPCIIHPNGDRVFCEHPVWDSNPKVPEHLIHTLYDPNRSWRFCHLDGVALDADNRPLRTIEAKTAGARQSHKWGEQGTDDIPMDYLVQAHHNVGIFRAATGMTLPIDVCVLIGGNDYRTYVIEFDAELDARIIEEEAQFWARFRSDTPPDPSPDARGQASYKVLHPQDTEGEIEATEAMEELAVEVNATRKAAILAKGEETAAIVRFMTLMDNAAKVTGDGWNITWRNNKDKIQTDFTSCWLSVVGKIEKGEAVTPEDIKAIAAIHTTTIPGPRVFRRNFPREEPE